MRALLLDPFAFDFMRRGLVVASMVATVCALLSCFLVLKGWSLMGDAVSHAVLPGLIVAQVLSLPLSVGAFAAGLVCAFATAYLRDHSRVREDAVMGIVFSGLFALGLVLFSVVPTNQHIMHVLFGNMLGVTWRNVLETAAVAIPTIAFVLLKRRDLMLFCFDPAHARTLGLSLEGLHTVLLVVLALAIVASLQAVGVILVVAMLITPGATALMLTNRFERMLAIAVVSAVSAAIIGTIASFHLDVTTGPLIVVVQSVIFCVSLMIAQVRARRATAAV
jgi:manganese/iron transport system permease protein